MLAAAVPMLTDACFKRSSNCADFSACDSLEITSSVSKGQYAAKVPDGKMLLDVRENGVYVCFA
jgi:hypothetical protein